MWRLVLLLIAVIFCECLKLFEAVWMRTCGCADRTPGAAVYSVDHFMITVITEKSLFIFVQFWCIYNNYAVTFNITKLLYIYCSTFRSNSKSSSGTTNCIKYKREYIKICFILIGIDIVFNCKIKISISIRQIYIYIIFHTIFSASWWHTVRYKHAALRKYTHA